MKKTLVLAGVIALATPVLFAVEKAEKKEAAGKAAKNEPTVAATPEDLVGQIATFVDEEESEEPLTEKAVIALWQKRVVTVDRLIAEFRKRYPEHPLRWRVMFLEANVREIREELGIAPSKESRPVKEAFAAIMAAPDAEPELKAEASAGRLIDLGDEVSDGKLPLDQWEKDLATHLKDFATYEENPVLIDLRLMLVEEVAPARLVSVLEELAKHPTAEIAQMATERLAAQKMLAELKSKPMELKFKAVDGREVDLEKLRGKVVLIDYWATWCGPCMAGLPELLETYGKLKDKGFEIVGISLDEEEEALKRVVKARKIEWPQYFDGKGWENPIARKYGIEGIPAMWLINKKGMVVETDAGEDLEQKVEKLLAE